MAFPSIPHLGESRKEALIAFGITKLNELLKWDAQELLQALVKFDPNNRSKFSRDIPKIQASAKQALAKQVHPVKTETTPREPLPNIPFFGESRWNLLRELGIRRRGELARANPESLTKKLRQLDSNVFSNELEVMRGVWWARAQEQGEPIYWARCKTPFKIQCPAVTYDLEYNCRAPPYVFGYAVGSIKEDWSVISWDFAVSLEDTTKIVNNFMDFVKSQPKTTFIGYNLEAAEFAILNKCAPRSFVQNFRQQCADVYNVILDHVAFPIDSIRLKPVGEFILGEKFHRIEASFEYEKYLAMEEGVAKQSLREKIVTYNQQDVCLTARVARWLEQFLATTPVAKEEDYEYE